MLYITYGSLVPDKALPFEKRRPTIGNASGCFGFDANLQIDKK